MAIDKDKMRAAIKGRLQNELNGNEMLGEVCEMVWEDIFNEPPYPDEADAEAYELFKTIYQEYINKMLAALK